LIGCFFRRMRRDLDSIQLLDLVPDVAFPKGHVDHRRLDVGMSRLHDREGIGFGHGHLRAEGVPKSMNANVGNTCAFAGPVTCPPYFCQLDVGKTISLPGGPTLPR